MSQTRPTPINPDLPGESANNLALAPSRFGLPWLYAGLIGLASGLVGLALLARLSFFWQQVEQRLTYPYFQSGSEGLILSETALIRAGSSIYRPFQADLFLSAPYPPLYYYLLAWLPAEGGSPSATLESGRLISLVAAFATAFCIAGLVFLARPKAPLFQNSRSLQKSKEFLLLAGLLALLAGLSFMSLPAVAIWAVRVRADMLMTALQMFGLVLVASSTSTGRGWLAFAAIGPFVLALATKQTALAGPGATLIYLACQNGRRWRPTLAWTLAMGLAVGLPFLGLNLATDGELGRRLFKYHNLPWLAANFGTYLNLFWQENAALLLLSLAGLGGLVLLSGLAWRKAGLGHWFDLTLTAGRQVPLVGWYGLASLLLLVGLGVAGADHNHFLPAEAGLCASVGTGAVYLLQAGRGRWLVLGVLAGLWAQLTFFSVPPGRYEIEFRPRTVAYQSQMARIIAYAASKPGPILTEEAGFLAFTGRTPQTGDYYNDLFTLSALDRKGLYSEVGLLERVRRKEFVLVLAQSDILNEAGRADVWTPALVAALKDNYTRKFADVWYTFEPKP